MSTCILVHSSPLCHAVVFGSPYPPVVPTRLSTWTKEVGDGTSLGTVEGGVVRVPPEAGPEGQR